MIETFGTSICISVLQNEMF